MLHESPIPALHVRLVLDIMAPAVLAEAVSE